MKAASRPYRMVRRAESAERNDAAILDAVLSFIPARRWEEITVEDIAAQAGVSVSSVLRRHGSKEGLARAAGERATAQILERHAGSTPGDLSRSVAEIAAHHERWGAKGLWMLEHARRSEIFAEQVRFAVENHRQWTARVFGPLLDEAKVRGARRKRLLAQLAATTDVLTWQMLRHRSGLSAAETEAAMREMCGCLLSGAR